MAEVGRIKLYDSLEGTVSAGEGNKPITFSNVTESFYTTISNDDVAGDISVRLKIGAMTDFGDAITIKASETLEFSDVQITAIDMTNATAADITYRVKVFGL